MKKTFLLIAALLMLGSAAFAGGGIDLAIGPKIGYQTAKLSYNKANIKSDFSNHFTAGVFGRVTVGRVYVQPEVLYFKTTNVFILSQSWYAHKDFSPFFRRFSVIRSCSTALPTVIRRFAFIMSRFPVYWAFA